ncbi:hypothetical protein CAOG_05163 [Capsaspora owczarzaki ATCC 30864]|uniref:Cell division cycle protein 123 n=1 Tax=Capsaspora owczarzaki (strain ATCC 30864) TaxID=595528 RepID=A0A0D2WRJ5_CAPO3|nr:hypothetical protein CAOG_05163 [Capsaspora owczarzaki ATCC 30864]KJE94530.1 hypothetical protein CAOG_005163 [Capsaspora owczarzaki ATCC 30864]|eukprot:XP_004346848.1 hypothetical protein CAOG_05163 [Capsaspora owczarzaki ATCC 30864]
MPAKPTRQHVLNCALPSWYPRFKHVSLRTEILPLTSDFVEYLLADGVFLSKDSSIGKVDPRDLNSYSDSDDDDDDGASALAGTARSLAQPNRVAASGFDSNDSSDDDWEQQSQSETDSIAPTAPNFPELEAAIKAAIATLGPVFPKLNWSAPQDASWIIPGGTIKCVSADEVFLLLKSSDFIVHDLCHSFDECSDLHDEPDSVPMFLALRRWHDLLRSMEFRCFVRNRQLIAISQRDVSNFYDFLPGMRATIRLQIAEFFAEHVRENFPNNDYVFDMYFNPSREIIKLVDFNPYHAPTSTALFDWEELEGLSGETVEVRVVDSPMNVQPSEYGAYKVPADVLSVQTTEDIERFAALFQSGQLA